MRPLLLRALAPCALVSLLLVSGCVTTRTYATAPVATAPVGSAAYFWDDLSPYGEWYQLSGYGWVWSPYDTWAGWRPYTYGRWAYSDYGWTWVSYHDWGWAPFHYGRWGYDSLYGWFWVPGTTWAPAWVAWRYGPGTVGWAPLPPSAVYYPGSGVYFGAGGIDVAIGASWWVFTEPRYLTSHRVYAHTVSGQRVPAVLRSTTPVVRYDEGRHGVIHRGLDVGRVEREARRSIPRIADEDLARTRAMSLERVERQAQAVVDGEPVRRRPDERLERPPRPGFEPTQVEPGDREGFGALQRQRPEERPSRRDPLRSSPPPSMRPDDIRPPARDPLPPMPARPPTRSEGPSHRTPQRGSSVSPPARSSQPPPAAMPRAPSHRVPERR